MISRQTLSPLDYQTVAAEATENLWHLCTVGGHDPDPNPRGVNYLTLRVQFYTNEFNEGRDANANEWNYNIFWKWEMRKGAHRLTPSSSGFLFFRNDTQE